jgi:NADPH:quinone reductase-like Zn-dependent oxidoreductase
VAAGKIDAQVAATFPLADAAAALRFAEAGGARGKVVIVPPTPTHG